MADLCTDSRFELIEKYKRMLIDATNIETCAEEMAVLGDIMHRIWQMGWLEKLEQTSAPQTGVWVEKKVLEQTEHGIDEWQSARCSVCGKYHTTPYMYHFFNFAYCPCCGAIMEEDHETG